MKTQFSWHLDCRLINLEQRTSQMIPGFLTYSHHEVINVCSFTTELMVIFLWSKMKLKALDWKQDWQEYFRKVKGHLCSNPAASASYLCAFYILEIPIVDLWSYSVVLTLRHGEIPKWIVFKVPSCKVDGSFAFPQVKVFLFCKSEVISWVIIIQHQNAIFELGFC